MLARSCRWCTIGNKQYRMLKWSEKSFISWRSGTQNVAIVTQIVSLYCSAPIVESYRKKSNISDKNWVIYPCLSYLIKLHVYDLKSLRFEGCDFRHSCILTSEKAEDYYIRRYFSSNALVALCYAPPWLWNSKCASFQTRNAIELKSCKKCQFTCSNAWWE